MAYNVVDSVTFEIVRSGLTMPQAVRDALGRGGCRYELRRAKSNGNELWISREPNEKFWFYLYSPESSEDDALIDMAEHWIDWNKHRFFVLSDGELDQLSPFRTTLPTP